MLYVIIFRNFRRKPYKKDCKQLSIWNPFYSKLLSKRIFLFCYYYMYRRLTDPELLRRLPHRSFCFYDIARNFYCTLLNIIFHDKILCVHYFYNVCGGLGGYVCGTPRYNRYNTVSAFSFLNSLCQNIFLPIYLLLVHRFRNNCIIHLSTNPIAQFKKPQRSPLRLRFFNCTLESVSCANDTVIYETMY